MEGRERPNSHNDDIAAALAAAAVTVAAAAVAAAAALRGKCCQSLFRSLSLHKDLFLFLFLFDLPLSLSLFLSLSPSLKLEPCRMFAQFELDRVCHNKDWLFFIVLAFGSFSLKIPVVKTFF